MKKKQKQVEMLGMLGMPGMPGSHRQCARAREREKERERHKAAVHDESLNSERERKLGNRAFSARLHQGTFFQRLFMSFSHLNVGRCPLLFSFCFARAFFFTQFYFITHTHTHKRDPINQAAHGQSDGRASPTG